MIRGIKYRYLNVYFGNNVYIYFWDLPILQHVHTGFTKSTVFTVVRSDPGKKAAPHDPPEYGTGHGTGTSAESNGDLQMSPETIHELANKTAELIVERIRKLPEKHAWDGEFKKELEDQLMEEPPEQGRAATEVLERAAKEILSLGARNDHPRLFAFVPFPSYT